VSITPSGPAAVAEGEARSTSAAATRRLGERLGRAAGPGTCLALVGPLGAGKTQLAKGVAAGLEVGAVVNSPTFVLMNEHVGRLPFFHVDAYRLEGTADAHHAGIFDERQAAGVTVIEWAERLGDALPLDHLAIDIGLEPGHPRRRRLRWRATGPRHAALARSLRPGRGPVSP
jgi:tRNA threonylcarbamoyladenosine biosynthesis protein TsaE